MARRAGQSGPPPPTAIKLSLTDEEVEKLGFKLLIKWNPVQLEVFKRKEQEIGFGGAKAGGKSVCGIGFLTLGGYHNEGCKIRRAPCSCDCPDTLPDGRPNPIYHSYTNHPKYLACVLRKNVTDLLDWVREAKQIYGPIGGQYKEGDKLFQFPSGATIFCGHYDDDSSWMKYQGMNIIRFVIEEAAQITDLTSKIKMLRSCNRSMFKEMKAQMLLTFNPGGPSHGEILSRYIEPLDANGDIIPPGTTITEEYSADEVYGRLGVSKPEGVGDTLKTTRVFIFSSIKDNPHALSNQEYLASLASMDDEHREAYLFGNWHILAGEYFKAFRPRGPYPGEPSEANHVVPYDANALYHPLTGRLKPWWWRTIAMDWGYNHDAVVLWGCHDQEDDRFWIEQEMAMHETEPDILGEELGRRTKPILERYIQMGQQPMITMGLSHDAYGLKQDDRSVAELIGRGIARVLGPSMVHLPDLQIRKLADQMEERGQSPNTKEADEIFRNLYNQQRMGITIRRMSGNRVVGWQFMRSMIRWKRTLPTAADVFDPNLASQIAYERGITAWAAYTNLFKQKVEVLPKLQIVGPPLDDRGRPMHGTGLGCERLIAAIPKAIHSETDPEDVDKKHVQGVSDFVDACRYLLMTFRAQSMPEPYRAKVERTIAEARAANPNVTTQDLIWLNRHLEKEKAEAERNKGLVVVRSSRNARARARGLVR